MPLAKALGITHKKRKQHKVEACDFSKIRQVIGNIASLCEGAGTSVGNVVRVLQLHTGIAEFYPVYKVWERRLGGRPLPFAAIEVPAPLPGATVIIEAWPTRRDAATPACCSSPSPIASPISRT